MKVLKKFLCVLLILAASALAGLAVYFGNGNPADQNTRNEIENPPEGILVDSSAKGQLAFMPEDGTSTGIVFYPGAKVEYDAYGELAERLARNGYLVVLADMPLNLALLNINAADRVIERYPDVAQWYLCGHSMGGLAASNYCWHHQDSVDGLILLASRIKCDFSDSTLPVLLISATEDGICTPEILEEDDTPLPADYTHVVIDGGCHGYFGSYGDQKMDGTPSISRQEQQDQTAEYITAFIEAHKGNAESVSHVLIPVWRDDAESDLIEELAMEKTPIRSSALWRKMINEENESGRQTRRA